MSRTDTHRPSVIAPEEYTYLGFQIHTEEMMWEANAAEMAHILRFMEARGASFSYPSGGVCAVCGNSNVIDRVAFFHAPTNSVIWLGTVCAQKMDLDYSDEATTAFQQARTAREAARKAKAGKLKAQGILEELGIAGAWAAREWEFSVEGAERACGILGDMVRKLVQYGEWSPKQEAFARKLWAEIEEAGTAEGRARREAEAAAEAARKAAIVIEAGRQEIVGEVVSTRVDEGPYGATTKMLVVREDGAKFWGTVPSGAFHLANVGERGFSLGSIKGGVARFTAAVEVSRDDRAFAFYKRPTCFSWVVAPQAEIVEKLADLREERAYYAGREKADVVEKIDVEIASLEALVA